MLKSLEETDHLKKQQTQPTAFSTGTPEPAGRRDITVRGPEGRNSELNPTRRKQAAHTGDRGAFSGKSAASLSSLQ